MTNTQLFRNLGLIALFASTSAAGCLVVNDVGDDEGLGGTSNAGGTRATGGRSADTGGAGERGGASSGGNTGGQLSAAGNGGEVSAAGNGGEGNAGGAGGEGGSTFSFTSVTVNESAQSGEIQLSGRLGIAEGRLALVLSSIKDPEDPTRPVAPDQVGFAVTIDGDAVECDINPTGDTVVAPVDVVFINDTTGSMAGSVNGIADSIRDFASSVAERGIDAQFSMVTYGDEFSTLSEGEEGFTEGQAEFTASSLDSQSRPYIDLSGLAKFRAFLAEMQASDDLGVGGGDEPENTLGALQYAIENLTWRESAARVFVVIGDNPAHTVASGERDGIAWDAHFVPPEVDSLLATLDGTAVAHVVARDFGDDPYYNLKELSDATGGAFIDHATLDSGTVDLTSISLNNWVGSTFFGVCFGIHPVDAERTMEIQATITGDAEHTGEVTYAITLE